MPPRAEASATGARLPMKAGSTCSASAISAASDSPPARATISALERLEAARRRLVESRMHSQQAIDRRAEGRLSAIHQPLARRQRSKMRAPDALDKSRLVRERHAARGRAEDQRETPSRIGRLSVDARAQRPERARVRVDEARPDRRSRIEPHRGGGFGGKPAPERRSRRRDVRAETREAVVAERAKPDALEELARPARFMRRIAKLAGDRAERARQRARRTKRRGSRSDQRNARPCRRSRASSRASQASFGGCISGDIAPPR